VCNLNTSENARGRQLRLYELGNRVRGGVQAFEGLGVLVERHQDMSRRNQGIDSCEAPLRRGVDNNGVETDKVSEGASKDVLSARLVYDAELGARQVVICWRDPDTFSG
jgi:hypothetical protein